LLWKSKHAGLEGATTAARSSPSSKVETSNNLDFLSKDLKNNHDISARKTNAFEINKTWISSINLLVWHLKQDMQVEISKKFQLEVKRAEDGQPDISVT